MGAVAIVVAQPGAEGAGAARRARVGRAVRPVADEGLNKPLRFAVGLRTIEPRAHVTHAERCTPRAKAMRAVARAIVGHDAFDADAPAGKPPHGAVEKARGHGGAL